MFSGIFNKRMVISVFIIFFCFLAAGVIVTFTKAEEPQNQNDEPSISAPSSVEESDIYIIKEYNGKIAVYNENMDKPVKTTDSSVDALPEVDKALLKKGIRVEDKTELRKLLEDYCS